MWLDSYKAGRGDYSNLMPQYFAEDLLRIYTKKTNYFGPVQVGYRAVLKKLADQYPDLDVGIPATFSDPIAPTPPATEAPTTPKSHSRNVSFTFGNAGAGSGLGTTPFSNNTFTTVSPTFIPGSPTQRTKRVMGTKRLRDRGEDKPRGGKSVKKRRSGSWMGAAILRQEAQLDVMHFSNAAFRYSHYASSSRLMDTAHSSFAIYVFHGFL